MLSDVRFTKALDAIESTGFPTILMVASDDMFTIALDGIDKIELKARFLLQMSKTHYV